MMGRTASAFGLSILAVVGASGCTRGPTGFQEPPNLLLVVVDTLRADHLPFYGYQRDTAPNLTRLMAQGGFRFENAYSTAPWTSPSVASILTGKDPSHLVHKGDLRAFGIPRREQTLARRLRAAGYDTAAFVGNALVHAGQGFGQGFKTFWVVPDGLRSIPYPAETVLEPALSWLAARKRTDRPFFLYVHFMDPHDPYTSPDLLDGRSEFFPNYDGHLSGDDIHPLAVGDKQLSSRPAEDVGHLRALYDSEIKYVDRAASRLIEAVERSSKRKTLIALTADHGEEIYDHLAWSHGHSVYEETIRVPLAFRCPGIVHEGASARENVSLVSIARTLLAVAKVSEEGVEGENLLPVLLGEAPEPARRPILVRHWHRGPMRAALLVDRRRTLLFNRNQPFEPDSRAEAHFIERERRRLDRFASFDLRDDPGQLRPELPPPEDIEAAYALLDPTLDGLRVVLRGLPGGETLEGSLRFGREPSGVMPFFLDENDEIVLDASTVRFRFGGEASPKGFLVLGALEGLETIELRPSGDWSVEIGEGLEWAGSTLTDPMLRRESWPAWRSRPGLRIWSRSSRALAPERPLDADTRATLQALGYL